MVDFRATLITFSFAFSFSLPEAWTRLQLRTLTSRQNQMDMDASVNFLVVGDWGGQDDHPYYTDPEKDVAEQMGQVAAAMGAQFTLSMGDNFYDNGVKDIDDPRFKSTFEVSATAKIPYS